MMIETKIAVSRFAALAQATRLDVLRLLVKAGPTGKNAGDLAAAMGVPASTLSFHLKELQHAGLVDAERRGRQIIYRAKFEGINDLVRFLLEDCCRDDPAIGDAPLAPLTPHQC